ncbi:acetyl/propionyl/methylcrotonyl-CoA carboxylase subunit alpha [Paenactinomyces guangxiensis]|uniref:biotin carboxylase n=1 Tax=Paenactinomyces guangxiensis TaxID=1490290 RepID=A0A7W2A8K6_9BACL|nr:acetyl-CoA carboxylase biotin carboxylase subunit [Paenactinomyces guangxiensis]MBA4494267.1 acetyl-CoA carboxylase biotin carboxylase subunit [Paenactinomyces guangxiensis]
MQKVLIANRGEIASRIIRSCRSRGCKTVAVYSEADSDLAYVSMADEAVCIGAPPVAKSYLNMDAILQAAESTGADAIHPGYGFLSENAAFAKKVMERGLVWIGPGPGVIAEMGDKVTARKAMIEAGVPVVPGTEGLQSKEDAVTASEKIGFPVMVKASAGGGGIGMHVVKDAAEMEKLFPSAQGRAKAYFGDDTLFLEKWVERSRHVEVQIAADLQGNVIHLYERECSVQRRNQKVIEESLSPSIHSETRRRLYEAAIRAAQAVHYTGVGTVEFLVGPDEEFYFLEMNTRLQVEHPVTECITGLDIVALQLDLAEGKQLPVRQEEVPLHGHAMEFRIYAEDPQTFLPSPGKLTEFHPPQGEGIRIDTGVKTGNTISPFYDPMIAKCIVSGCTREEVLSRSRKALQAFRIAGIKTNIPLLLEVLDDPVFIDGHYDTHILANRTKR